MCSALVHVGTPDIAYYAAVLERPSDSGAMRKRKTACYLAVVLMTMAWWLYDDCKRTVGQLGCQQKRPQQDGRINYRSHKPKRAKEVFRPHLPPSVQRANAVRDELAAYAARVGVSCCWGALLDGVGVYVLDLPSSSRRGKVTQQGKLYGLHEGVHVVDAITPNTTVGGYADAIARHVRRCSNRTTEWTREQRQQRDIATAASSRSHGAVFNLTQKTIDLTREDGALQPYILRPTAVACTLSHLKARQIACEARTRGGPELALVLEDDASFAPMEYPLSTDLSYRYFNGPLADRLIHCARLLGRPYPPDHRTFAVSGEL